MQIAMQEHAFLIGAEGLSVRRQAEQIGIVTVIAVAQFSAEAEIIRGRAAEVDVLEALVVAERLGLAREPEIILLPAVEPEADLLLRPGLIASRLLRHQRVDASKEPGHGAYHDGERCNSVQPISTATAHRKTIEGAMKIAPDRHDPPTRSCLSRRSRRAGRPMPPYGRLTAAEAFHSNDVTGAGYLSFSEAFDHLFPLAFALLAGGLVLHYPEGRNALWVHDKVKAANSPGHGYRCPSWLVPDGVIAIASRAGSLYDTIGQRLLV